MKKFTFLLCLLLIPSLVCAQEKITGFEDKDLPVLNEELRRTTESIEELETTVEELETIPAGVIVMWSGAISAIPSGWALCDGNNGTPDLTDRFVLHADADTGGTNDVGDTGDATAITDTHTLTLAEIPEHSHNIKYYSGSGGLSPTTPGATSPLSAVNYDTSTQTSWATNVYSMDMAGSSGSHSHDITDLKPKYYALAFIMKL